MPPVCLLTPVASKSRVVEVLNIIDVGTSFFLDAHVGADFHAETALQAIVQTFQRWGRPRQITTDRDVRLVGSPHGSDFPSALRRLCACLGIEYVVCPREPTRSQRLCGTVPSLLATGMPQPGAASHAAGSGRSHQSVC